MAKCQTLVLCLAFLLAFVASAHLCLGDSVASKDVHDAPASSSFFKGWSDWAQGKVGSYGKKGEETKAAAADSASSWSSWASDKISAFSGRTSKDVGKATQAAKEQAKAEKDLTAKEVQETLESAKGSIKEGSEKAKDYAGKGKEGAKQQADKAYEAGSDAAQKLKRDSEL